MNETITNIKMNQDLAFMFEQTAAELEEAKYDDVLKDEFEKVSQTASRLRGFASKLRLAGSK